MRPARLAEGWTRDRIVEAVMAEGVPCFQGSCSEVYLEKAFQDADLAPPERLPIARELGETAFSLLVHPTLTAPDMHRACAVLDRVILAATQWPQGRG